MNSEQQNKECSYNNIITHTNQLIDFDIYNIFTGGEPEKYIFGGWRVEKKDENWVFKNYYYVVFYNLPFVDSFIYITREPTYEEKQKNSITIPVYWDRIWNNTYYLDLSNNGIDKIQYCKNYDNNKKEKVGTIIRNYSYTYDASKQPDNITNGGSKRRKSRKFRKFRKFRKSRKSRKIRKYI